VSEVNDPAVDDKVAVPVRTLGRFGLVAYGAVHVLIAALVVQVAFGDRERADKKGALQQIGETGPGVVLLWVVTAGLVALVVWQLAEAVLGHTGVPTSQRALRIAVNLAEAAIFGVLAYSAGSIAASGGRATAKPSFAQVVFGLPGGGWLVGLAGVGLVAGGAFAVWRGLTRAFLRELDLSGAGLNRSRLVTRVGQVGWTALAAVYGIPGVLLVVAAVRHAPAQPVGLDSGLKALAGQPFGPVLLLVLAAGLVAFGVHCLFDARYRRA
jgi:hypothetical protein